MARQLTPEQKAAKAARAKARRARKSLIDKACSAAAARIASTQNEPIALDQDGKPVFVGDWVCFKDGIEQYGKAIARDGLALEVEMHDDMTGEKYTRVINRFWIEG